MFFLSRMDVFCIAVLFALLRLTCSSPATIKLWEEWKHQHNKGYNNQVWFSKKRFNLMFYVGAFMLCRFQTELVFRRAIWEKNLLLVYYHNQEVSAGKHSFMMGLNHLADMVGLLLTEFINFIWETEGTKLKTYRYSVLLKHASSLWVTARYHSTLCK